jgi:carbonic anhydrase/acetyltransferase-like protein (isoleucine patch superfamily)
MAKFKCLISGNVIEFTNQVDIDSMVGHEGYVRLEEETPTAPVVKKAGRPAKVVTEVTSTEEAE